MNILKCSFYRRSLASPYRTTLPQNATVWSPGPVGMSADAPGMRTRRSRPKDGRATPTCLVEEAMPCGTGWHGPALGKWKVIYVINRWSAILCAALRVPRVLPRIWYVIILYRFLLCSPSTESSSKTSIQGGVQLVHKNTARFETVFSTSLGLFLKSHSC